MSVTFNQSRNFTPTNGRAIDLIVLHDMEAPPGPFTAENVSSWFAGLTAPEASAHWCFDQDSQVRCVEDKDVAWHAPGVNHNSVGYEHAGYARSTRDEWLTAEGVAMLRLSAAQAAEDCVKYAIPPVYVDAAGILAGERGITTHLQVTTAYPLIRGVRYTHWDPGYEFPLDLYLAFVAEALGGAPVVAVPIAPAPAPDKSTVGSRVLRIGSIGDDVRQWQEWLGISADGIFGPQTDRTVRAFQSGQGLVPDGVIGPLTVAAMAAVLAAPTPAPDPAPAPEPAPAPDVPPFPGTTSLGSRGEAVRQVQQRLADRGWGLSADGSFGPMTDRVVRAFQADKDLDADGIVGPLTWSALWLAPLT